ncbi:hypothetical protein SAMN02927921_03021 [Sinomicrobium oceani]|uniref:Uncharacterized protein n=1 Tax=Sinomicrobium oceani TaxID=1150368 RepID=A0A1K1R003_9FLAO|nr:hypothetical protein SAMN02927921_03021 [Sinomicrobium oceani]
MVPMVPMCIGIGIGRRGVDRFMGRGVLTSLNFSVFALTFGSIPMVRDFKTLPPSLRSGTSLYLKGGAFCFFLLQLPRYNSTELPSCDEEEWTACGTGSFDKPELWRICLNVCGYPYDLGFQNPHPVAALGYLYFDFAQHNAFITREELFLYAFF